MITLRTALDKMGYFGIHLYLKDPKSAKKWQSTAIFPLKTLHDYIENHFWTRGGTLVLICT